MPAKYSHVKKRPASGPKKKAATSSGGANNLNGGKEHHRKDHPNHHKRLPNHMDRGISNAMTAVSQLERAIARIFLIRFEQDIARLFSTHLYCVALIHLPTFVMRCITVGGPGWVAHNADCEEIKDFFRSVVSMELRQSGERVATKSVLWSYTALRDFALSNNVPVCRKRGLHSLRLLPFYDALKAHLDVLEGMPHASFAKPPHLGPLTEGLEALEEACELKYGEKSLLRSTPPPGWDQHWRLKVRLGYERVSQTLWRVAREFDVSGYGNVLREKLTTKWCDCGCSTDHLGEVCEKTVREDEENSGVRSGKQREWDGRGSGVHGWETEEEEDVWDLDLDFTGNESEEEANPGSTEPEMTIAEIMEVRFLRAEKEKELGNAAFRRGDFELAVRHYQAAHSVEPEMPHYQLNIAAAYLKLNNWIEAEKACTKALSQHRSIKGYYRRAKARRMLEHIEEATKDLRSALKIQPTNTEALDEMLSLLPPEPSPPPSPSYHNEAASSSMGGSNSATLQLPVPSNHDRLQLPKSRQPKQLPFARTKADDRKLKIMPIPVMFEVPEYMPGDPSATWKSTKALKVKNVTTKTETFLFPSWEKYTVKQVVG
ncbi:hypothetical protein HYDPIDRAFT_182579 [Hydnomerulius pinastri MD-312]|uniref:Unplaced genomic scaffold scaffold_19, whole genome shotgun sequence n=1 Tax=Hydnomerulius pinastri MD-312 TaxID=994086 RepID=A0A0C9VXE5_9AGAM|nr:hypothetical protein HYDPIDRAFT_182579 [Hydnomerulius pinastri MD-312]